MGLESFVMPLCEHLPLSCRPACGLVCVRLPLLMIFCARTWRRSVRVWGVVRLVKGKVTCDCAAGKDEGYILRPAH